MPPIVAAAGIAAGASIVGGVIGGKAAKGAAKAQADTSKLALEEQRRIYEIESKKEQERYERERADKELDRAERERDRQKGLQDEQRVLGSRRNAFGGFSDNLSRFSQGYAPAYGMSEEQTQGVMARRNVGPTAGMSPLPPDPGLRNMADQGGSGMNMAQFGATRPSASLGSTVWLQAPTGETMEVPIDQAPQMLQAGAVLIPAPTGG